MEDGKNNILNKILLFVFIGLFLIIVGELIYFYLLNNRSIKTAATPPSSSTINKNKIIPSLITPVISSSFVPTKKEILSSFLSFVDKKLIPDAEKGMLQSFLITLEYQGEINEIKKEIKVSNLALGNTPYSQAALLSLKKNNYIVKLSFTESDLKKIKLFTVNQSGGKKPTNFEDLQPGDQISINLLIDWFKNPNDNLVSGTLNKYLD